ncbi:MAG TPA: sialidase family protein [Candidatus Bathyarchaeia archaeon]|nr:sialidase family protein [Candidatus Bathyarchaeia archaeon]
MRRLFVVIVLILALSSINAHIFSTQGIIMPQRYSFNPSTPLEQPFVSGPDFQPVALQASNGTIWIAWQSNRDGPLGIYLKTFNGIRWTPTTSIVAGSAGVANSHPALAQLRDGSVMLLWSSNATRNWNLYYKTFLNNAWSLTIQLSSGPFDDTWSRMVMSGSTLWLTWQRDNSAGVHQIFYRAFSGNSWSPETMLTPETNRQNESPTVMAVKGGAVWFAWARSLTIGGAFNITSRTFDGTTWSTDKLLTTSSTSSTYPYLLQDRNGTIWLFWSRLTLTDTVLMNKVWAKYSVDLGTTWSTEIQLTTGGQTLRPQQDIQPVAVQGFITTIDRSIWVFYSSNANFLDYDIYYIRSTPVTNVHDIAVTGVQVVTPYAYTWGDAPQSLININVNVTNLGDAIETMVTVNVQVSNTTTYSLSPWLTNYLPPGQTVTATFTWDTIATLAQPARYTVKATASLPPKTEMIGNLGDNVMVQKYAAKVLLIGALDKRDCVTIISAGMMGRAFGSTPGTFYWNPDADLANQGVVTIISFGILAAQFDKCI